MIQRCIRALKRASNSSQWDLPEQHNGFESGKERLCVGAGGSQPLDSHSQVRATWLRRHKIWALGRICDEVVSEAASLRNFY